MTEMLSWQKQFKRPFRTLATESAGPQAFQNRRDPSRTWLLDQGDALTRLQSIQSLQLTTSLDTDGRQVRAGFDATHLIVCDLDIHIGHAQLPTLPALVA